MESAYVVVRGAQKHSGLHLGQVKGRKKDLACLGKGLANNNAERKDALRLPAGPENLNFQIPVLTAQRSPLVSKLR
jgi:hypothetical protein